MNRSGKLTTNPVPGLMSWEQDRQVKRMIRGGSQVVCRNTEVTRVRFTLSLTKICRNEVANLTMSAQSASIRCATTPGLQHRELWNSITNPSRERAGLLTTFVQKNPGSSIRSARALDGRRSLVPQHLSVPRKSQPSQTYIRPSARLSYLFPMSVRPFLGVPPDNDQ